MIGYAEFLWTLVIFSLAFLTWWYVATPKNLPPGPLGLPLIGCAHFVKPTTAHLTFFRWSKQYGPIFSFYQASRLVIVISDYDLLQDALQKQDVFHGKPAFMLFKPRPPKYGLIPAEGARWQEQRRFTLATLRDFGFGRPILEPKVTFEVEDVLSFITKTNGQSFDPQPVLSSAITNVISSMVFGYRFELDSKLKYHLDQINYRLSQSQINNFSPAGLYPWLRHVVWPFSKKLQQYLGGGENLLRFLRLEIDSVRKDYNPRTSQQAPECFVHAFDKAAFDGQGKYFDDMQLVAVVNDLFLAGGDTTSTTLRWALFYMATHSDIQNKVYQEIVDAFGQDGSPTYADRLKLPYTVATLMEIQRLGNLLPFSLVHRATENARLSGYNVPKDAWIVPLVWAVHHNSAYFPEPDKFDPNHFLDEKKNLKTDLPLIPFSLGKRICLGESLARMELFLFFTALMQKFQFYFPSQDYSKAPPLVGILRSPSKYLICARKRQS